MSIYHCFRAKMGSAGLSDRSSHSTGRRRIAKEANDKSKGKDQHRIENCQEYTRLEVTNSVSQSLPGFPKAL
jgi:hypothetical protein